MVPASDRTSPPVSVAEPTSPPARGNGDADATPEMMRVVDVMAWARLAELERALGERTRQLDETTRELEAICRAMSHDLRAPLRGISGCVREIREQHGGSLPPEGRRALGLIGEQAEEMSGLIGDLASYSRLGRQALSPASIDMGALAHSTYRELSELTIVNPRHRPTLELGSLPAATADRFMVRALLTKLFDNALKFTAGRPDIRIAMNGVADGDWVTFCVSDNGVGFEPRYVEKLFTLFQRLHVAGSFRGNGVGLAVVRRIVERHGGKTWAEGRVDGGAKIYFTLPRGGPVS